MKHLAMNRSKRPWASAWFTMNYAARPSTSYFGICGLSSLPDISRK